MLCWNGDKTEEHLFHSCEFAKEVLSELRRKAGYNKITAQLWQEELKLVKEKTKGEGIR